MWVTSSERSLEGGWQNHDLEERGLLEQLLCLHVLSIIINAPDGYRQKNDHVTRLVLLTQNSGPILHIRQPCPTPK